jgi:hypothetical protein
VRILTKFKGQASVVRERETIDNELRFVEQVGPELSTGTECPSTGLSLSEKRRHVTSMNGSTSS